MYKKRLCFSFVNFDVKKMKICQIYNFAPHYRAPIYSLLSKEFDTDFVFGRLMGDIKKMDYDLLRGNVLEVEYISKNGLIYQTGIVSMLFKQYDKYVLTGEPRNISVWLFLLCAKLFHKKQVFLWTHGYYGKENKIKHLLNRFFYNLADGIFLYGNYARNLMLEDGFNENKLFVVHNSLDYEQQMGIRKQLLPSNIYKDHFGNSYPVIIFIGRLTKEKKLHQLVDMLEIFKNRGEIFNLIFVGDGVDKGTLENLVKEKNLTRQVWFYGACYDELMNAEMIYNADLCIAPGNVGLTAIHVMMFGTPVLTHNDFMHQMPEFESIIPSVTGDFFYHDNLESMTECVEKWFMMNKDREKVRSACMEEIDKSWNPIYQLKIFKSVLNKE